MALKPATLACRLISAGLLAGGLAHAQAAPDLNSASTTPPRPGWQVCQALKADPRAQLACFQQWADAQSPAAASDTAASTPAVTTAAAPAGKASAQPQPFIMFLPSLNTDAPDGKPLGCKNDQYSELSRFWELQRGTDCSNFAIRGYRPLSLAVVASDGVNTQPSSPSAGHTALTATPYKRTENKIQLSVRTKIAKGLLKSGPNDEDEHDSLWFGYTQQSYWQLFSPSISRPFRSTDHEPELIYIYPQQITLAGGWNYRLSGLGLVHQSNGQSLPLSRSWNRVYLMGAAEKTLGPHSSLILQGRIWDRLREKSGDDDNPGIENYLGRAELAGRWQINQANTLGLTLRHSLRKEARGSARFDWLMAPTASPNYTGLRYHVQFFSGYGDSLLDYNRKRKVLSLGLSLVDW